MPSLVHRQRVWAWYNKHQDELQAHYTQYQCVSTSLSQLPHHLHECVCVHAHSRMARSAMQSPVLDCSVHTSLVTNVSLYVQKVAETGL